MNLASFLSGAPLCHLYFSLVQKSLECTRTFQTSELSCVFCFGIPLDAADYNANRTLGPI